MTLIGKIFTVLIFVMSIFFMALSVMVFATHTNWKMKALDPQKGYVVQLKALDETNNKLRTEIVVLNQKISEQEAARRHVLASLQTQLANAKKALELSEADLAQHKTTLSGTLAKLELAQTNLEQAQKDNKTVRDNIVTIAQDRDDKLKRVIELSDKTNEAKIKLVQMQERQQQLIGQISHLRLVMAQNDLDPHAPLPVSLEKPLDGLITYVGQRNLVEVSIGSDDGLREDNVLTVYRDTTYLGKIKIIKVTANKATGEIMKDTIKVGNPIRKGDRVASKLT